jgi:hypothetical protein
MAIQRGASGKSSGPVFTVGLNIVLNGSKEMSEAAQEAVLTDAASDTQRIEVIIRSSKGVLVETVLDPKQFSTGSVGWGLQEKAAFPPV